MFEFMQTDANYYPWKTA